MILLYFVSKLYRKSRLKRSKTCETSIFLDLHAISREDSLLNWISTDFRWLCASFLIWFLLKKHVRDHLTCLPDWPSFTITHPLEKRPLKAFLWPQRSDEVLSNLEPRVWLILGKWKNNYWIWKIATLLQKILITLKLFISCIVRN